MGYEKGEVVLKDVPFAYVIKVERRAGICDFCVKPSKKALKNCSACKVVYYCNGNCQKSAWNSHHQVVSPTFAISKPKTDNFGNFWQFLTILAKIKLTKLVTLSTGRMCLPQKSSTSGTQ